MSAGIASDVFLCRIGNHYNLRQHNDSLLPSIRAVYRFSESLSYIGLKKMEEPIKLWKPLHCPSGKPCKTYINGAGFLQVSNYYMCVYHYPSCVIFFLIWKSLVVWDLSNRI